MFLPKDPDHGHMIMDNSSDSKSSEDTVGYCTVSDCSGPAGLMCDAPGCEDSNCISIQFYIYSILINLTSYFVLFSQINRITKHIHITYNIDSICNDYGYMFIINIVCHSILR